MFKEEYSTKQDFLSDLESQASFTGVKYHKPFLKWAGGKTQLVPELISLLPGNFNKYIEPFIGDGALFFAINHPGSVISERKPARSKGAGNTLAACVFLQRRKPARSKGAGNTLTACVFLH
jgi:hypothetical protein